MAKTSLSIDNRHKPAPRWFRKWRRAISYLADASIVILLATGYDENDRLILILRVGLYAAFDSLEVLLANGEEYTTVEQNQ